MRITEKGGTEKDKEEGEEVRKDGEDGEEWDGEEKGAVAAEGRRRKQDLNIYIYPLG